MTSRIVHIRNPIAPALDMRAADIEAGANVTGAVDRAGWRLPPSTFLLRRDMMDTAIDWNTARHADVFVRRAAWDDEPFDDGETRVLVTLPQGGGQGGSQIGQILAHLAVLALAVVAAYFLGPFAFIATMIGGQLLLNAILPTPKPPPTPTPTYQIGAQSNMARLGEAIPERFGRTCVFADLRSQPYIEYDSNTESVFQLFCIGVGDYYVEQIRIGTNVVAQADDTGTLQSTGTYPEISWQLVGPDEAVTLFPDNVFTSTEISDIELLGKNQLNWQWTAWFVANPPNTQTTLIAFDMSLPAGLYSQGSSGKLGTATAIFTFQAQLIDDLGVTLGDPFTALTIALELQTNQPQRVTYEANVPCGRYQVRGRRTNTVNQSGGPGDPLIWANLRSFLPSHETYGDCTMIAVKALATYNLSQLSADQFNFVVTRILTTPVEVDGVWQWSATPQPTRSIGAAAYYLLTASNCADLDPSQFDQQWLLNYEALWQSRGDTFDGAFTSQQSFADVLNTALNVGRSQAVFAPLIGFVRDEAKSLYRCAFTPRSMLPKTFGITYQFYDPTNADAITLTYTDERNWTQTQLFVALPDSTRTVDTAPQTTVNGMVNRDQIWREWNYKLAASACRRIMPGFQTELDGRVCYRGDLVSISHIMPGWGASADVLSIELDDDGDILTLSEPWTLTDGEPMLQLATPDGYVAGPVAVTVLDDGDLDGESPDHAIVQLLAPCAPTQGKYAGLPPRSWGIWGINPSDSLRDLQRERPKAIMGQGTAQAMDALIVSMAPQANQKCQVACVVDDPRVYVADQVPVPPYITGSCDGGNANLQVTSLEITQSSGSYPDGKDVVLSIDCIGAADADSFDYQFSLNYGPWQGPFTGNLRDFVFRTFAGPMQLQVRGAGAGEDGNWYSIDFDADGTGVVGLGLDFSVPSNSQYLAAFMNFWS